MCADWWKAISVTVMLLTNIVSKQLPLLHNALNFELGHILRYLQHLKGLIYKLGKDAYLSKLIKGFFYCSYLMMVFQKSAPMK